MASIKIIKNQNDYSYKYEIIGKDDKRRYITKSGFKTQEEALEAGKKSFYKRIKDGYKVSDNTSKQAPPKKNIIKPKCLSDLILAEAPGLLLLVWTNRKWYSEEDEL